MLLGLQEGALEAPQAGVGDALFQHDVITHPAATATGLGGAGLASSRATSWRATQPSEAWSLPWDINQSLDGQLLPQHSSPYSGSGWLTQAVHISHWVLKLEQVGGECNCDIS